MQEIATIQTENTIKPRRKGISGSTLKIIAMASMLLDHIGFFLLDRVLIQCGIMEVAEGAAAGGAWLCRADEYTRLSLPAAGVLLQRPARNQHQVAFLPVLPDAYPFAVFAGLRYGAWANIFGVRLATGRICAWKPDVIVRTPKREICGFVLQEIRLSCLSVHLPK